MMEELKDNMTDTGIPDVDWTVDHENILVEWGDKAKCYRWLHSKSNGLYYYLNTMYTIPVIVISTLTGTANFAQSRVPPEYQNYFAMIVGAFNITAGIITTVQQFLKITQLNEAHRVSSIAWDKFQRNITIELAKHPRERIHVNQMIKMCKEEFDRLMETSPVIPDKIVKQFEEEFRDDPEFVNLKKPEICNSLVSTDKSRNTWFSEENMEKNRLDTIRNARTKENQERAIVENRKSIVRDFKNQFFSLNKRPPMDSEIIDNLRDKMDLEILKDIIEEQKPFDDSDNIIV